MRWTGFWGDVIKKGRENLAVITGTGCISGAGVNVETCWAAVSRGKVNCGPVPDWLFETSLSYPVFTAPQEPLTDGGKRFLDRVCDRGVPLPALNRTMSLVISSLSEALEGAGLSVDALQEKRVGIAIGTTVGCTFNNEDYYLAWRQGKRQPIDTVVEYLGSNLAWALHRLLGTTGPSVVVANACASGTDAIGIAKEWIEQGACDIAIAGGADELTHIAYNGFACLQLTDEAPCKPFDAARNGLNLGEGAGIMILESDKEVAKRGATPLGWMKGYGTAADAYHPTAPHPEGRGLREAFLRAVRDAGVKPEEISYVNCHGTGTKANDRAETNCLAFVFHEGVDIPMVSTKGITGHTLGAAGAIEAIFTLEALRAGWTPGTTGCRRQDEDLRVRVLAEGMSVELHGRLGASQSLAFGGGNSVLLLEAA